MLRAARVQPDAVGVAETQQRLFPSAGYAPKARHRPTSFSDRYRPLSPGRPLPLRAKTSAT
jgi:hypothetical protein